MSPAQLEELQTLSQIFSQGKANLKQVQQLSALSAQINGYEEGSQGGMNEQNNFIAAPMLG